MNVDEDHTGVACGNGSCGGGAGVTPARVVVGQQPPGRVNTLTLK
jgi:hypothetical protein